MRGFIFLKFRITRRWITHWVWTSKICQECLTRFKNSSLIPSLNWFEFRVCSTGGCCLIVKIGFCSLRIDGEKIQVREVMNWGGGQKDFRFVELGRQCGESEWILWTYTGYMYLFGHMSLQFRMRADKNIWRANRVGGGWFQRWRFFR